ncbi:GPCR fungal pheromone mating factor [Amylostereum chailletii]|nr:GPCR fungal pheromone mating factor [Amylostereum chailletii]
MDPTFPLVPIANLLASILVIISLISSAVRKTVNVGAALLGAWLVVSTLITGVEAIVWRNDAENRAPGWCDFSSHIIAGSTVAIPACSLIIARRLHQIIQIRSVEPPTVTEKRLQLLVDLSLGLGLPIVVMGLYYIVQMSRYQVVEEVGCASITASDDGMTILLLNSWTILLPAISILFYFPRLVWSFYKHQRRLNEFARTTDPNSCTRSRFLRLLLIASFDVLVTLPCGVLNLVMNVKGGPLSHFWEGWSIVHSPAEWPAHLAPASLWRQNPWYRAMVAFDQWANVVLALAFFVLFGITHQSRALYARAFWAVAGVVGWKRPPRDEDVQSAFEESLKFNYSRRTDEFSEYVVRGSRRTWF